MKRESQILLIVVLTLLCVGVLTVYSVSATTPKGMSRFTHHVGYIAIGLIAMFVCSITDYRTYSHKYIFGALILVTAFLLCLVAIPFIGTEVGGARRWLRIAGFGFQPSELAKLALIVWVAAKLSENQYDVKSFLGGFVTPLFMVGSLAALILIEKDLGGPLVLVVTTLAMMVMAGTRLIYIVISAIPISGLVSIMALTSDYRLRRLMAFLDPWEHRKGDSFQLIQSLQAFMQGNVFGRGAGASEQKLAYLPEAHTDFIFAIWSEEMGLLGSLFVVALFLVLLYVGLRIALHARDLFGSLLAGGIVFMTCFQAAFIMAVTIGLLPTKGLPLPFVSCGGTAIILYLAAMGIVINVGLYAEEPIKVERLPLLPPARRFLPLPQTHGDNAA